jgi:hypothetical protein
MQTFGAMLQTGEPLNSSTDNIRKQAESMIVYDPNSCRKERLSAAVAITGILANTDWHIELCASGYIERRLAFLLEYNRHNDKVFVSYPPEPVLAMAALVMLQRFPSEILEELEKVDHVAFSRGLGPLGEFAAKILFLVNLSPPSLLKPYNSVKPLFEYLFGTEAINRLENIPRAEEIMGGRLCVSYFTNFIKIGDDPERIIGALIRMNAALATPTCYPGFDLLIPIILQAGNLGCIYIQVKNVEGKLSRLTEVESKLWEQLASNRVRRLNMIINVCPYGVDNFEVKGEGQTTTILVEGWNRCFGETFRRCPRLENILHTILSRGRQNNPISERLPYNNDLTQYPYKEDYEDDD